MVPNKLKSEKMANILKLMKNKIALIDIILYKM
jgi:hypothetical protein